MSHLKNKDEYLQDFSNQKGTKTKNSQREEALKNALDIRKFKI